MSETGFTFNPKLYNVLKWVALVLLPAVGTFYFAMGQIWHFPAIEEVVGSITALDTFLGILINKSSKNHQAAYDAPSIKGEIVISQDRDGVVQGMRFVATEDPLIFDDGKLAAFQVKREQT